MSSEPSKRILIVVTSNERFGDSAEPTGYYLSEVSHPFARFKAAGYAVDFLSPKGGKPPVDPGSVDRNDESNRALLDDREAMAKLEHTLTPESVDVDAYDAVLFAGGLGTMWDFAQDERLGRIAASSYEHGKVVAAVCHGPAALLSARLRDGRWLVAGHTVAAFSNAEETAAGHDGKLPYYLESALKERGASYVSAPLWQAKVAVSARLVTGQNPASATGVADAVLALLSPRAS